MNTLVKLGYMTSPSYCFMLFQMYKTKFMKKNNHGVIFKFFRLPETENTSDH